MIILAGFSFVELALPRLVESWIRSELRARGIEADLEVTSVGMSSTHIGRMSFPRLGVDMSAIVVSYTLSDLLGGRVETVSVGDCRWRLDVNTFGGLGNKTLGESLGDISVGRIDFASVSMRHRRWQRWAVEWSGSVARNALATTAELVGTAAGLPFRATAELSADRARLGIQSTGSHDLDVDLVARFGSSSGPASFDLRASGREVQLDMGPGFAAADIQARVHGQIVGRSIESLDGRVVVRDVAVGDVGARVAELDLHHRGDRIDYAITSAAAFGRLSAAGSVPADVGLWAPGSSFPIAVDAELHMPGVLLRGARRRGLSVSPSSPLRLSASGALERGHDRWAASFGAVRLAATADAIAAPGRHQLRDVDVELLASARLTRTRAEIELHSGSSLGVRRLSLGASDHTARSRAGTGRKLTLTATSPVRMRLAYDLRPLALRSWHLSAPAARLRARGIELSSPFGQAVAAFDVPVWIGLDSRGQRLGFLSGGQIEATDIRMRVGARSCEADAATFHVLRGSASFRRGRVRRLTALTSVEVEDVRVGGLELGRVAVKLPLEWPRRRRSKPRPGSLRVSDATWRGHPLPSLEGELAQLGDGWRFAGSAKSATSSLAVSARAPRLSLDDSSIRVDAPSLVLSRSETLGKLVSAVAGIQVEGRVGLEAEAHLESHRVLGRASVVLDGVAVSSKERDLELTDVTGRVEVSRTGATGAVLEQQIAWRSAAAAGQRLGPGGLVLETDESNRVFVRRAFIRLGSGTISAAPFTLVLDGTPAHARLSLEGIDLERWLPTVSRGKLLATGTVDGKLDLRVATTDWSLSIGAGRLRSRGSGRLWFHDEQLLADLVTEYLPRATSMSDAVARRLLAALADFDYDSLSVELFDRPDHPDVRLLARGRGHRVPQEVDLTVNGSGVRAFVCAALDR